MRIRNTGSIRELQQLGVWVKDCHIEVTDLRRAKHMAYAGWYRPDTAQRWRTLAAVDHPGGWRTVCRCRGGPPKTMTDKDMNGNGAESHGNISHCIRTNRTTATIRRSLWKQRNKLKESRSVDRAVSITSLWYISTIYARGRYSPLFSSICRSERSAALNRTHIRTSGRVRTPGYITRIRLP